MKYFDRLTQRGEASRMEYLCGYGEVVSSEVSNLMSWVQLPLSAPSKISLKFKV